MSRREMIRRSVWKRQLQKRFEQMGEPAEDDPGLAADLDLRADLSRWASRGRMRSSGLCANGGWLDLHVVPPETLAQDYSLAERASRRQHHAKDVARTILVAHGLLP